MYFCQTDWRGTAKFESDIVGANFLRPKLERLVQYFALALAPNEYLGGFCCIGSNTWRLPPDSEC